MGLLVTSKTANSDRNRGVCVMNSFYSNVWFLNTVEPVGMKAVGGVISVSSRDKNLYYRVTQRLYAKSLGF
jgi:hypothetical protein